MHSKVGAVIRARLVRKAVELMLGFCILGLPGASASTAFLAYGLLTDGATFIGNLTIDTVSGTPTTVDITVSAPDSLHALAIQASYSASSSDWVVLVGATGNSTPSLLLVIPANTLVGYAGGPLSTLSNLGGGGNPLLGGVLAANVAPSVTTNPSSQMVCAGQGVSFTAAATGNPIPTVQWQVSTNNGAIFNDIPLATSSTLTFFSVSASQDGNQYQAAFTGAGSAYSTAATLTVTTPPVVTTNPLDQTFSDIPDAQTLIFTAAATNFTGLQWQLSTDGGATFNDIPGQTSPTLTVDPTVQKSGYQYRAVFTNACGSSTTSAATPSVVYLYLLRFFSA